MKRVSQLLAVFLFAFVACNVYADNLKVGVLNLDEVIQKSPLALSLNDKLSKDFKPRQDALNKAQQKLQDDMDQLNYNSFKLSTADRNQLQITINNDKRDFESQSASLQRDLATAQSQYSQTLMAKLNTVIAKIAKDEHYDIIQTSVNILFLNNSINITQQVVDQLK